ncbi:hypothetical protein J2R78_005121 [Bradyrhizobium sp. USDA 4538]|nr:hypothetical protein [Bradyrhizobium sp. USDA 4538]MCP1902718.1 hypothetical protein [Bradyrhizobium sp. USDA 4537]MCP1991625.1 hypothetical protein [Bradyrhizobium sp. USDA 4539]
MSRNSAKPVAARPKLVLHTPPFMNGRSNWVRYWYIIDGARLVRTDKTYSEERSARRLLAQYVKAKTVKRS